MFTLIKLLITALVSIFSGMNQPNLPQEDVGNSTKSYVTYEDIPESLAQISEKLKQL